MDPTGNSPGIAIGHLALRRGLITPEQLREALAEQSKSSGATLQPLDSILIAKGFLKRGQIEELHLLRESTTLPVAPSPASPPSADVPPTVGKYRIVREAGRGAMARVYEALDPELQRKVALKVLTPSANAHPEESGIEEQRFLREAQLAANLPKHPNIVGVYDAGVIEGRRYIAMEFVDGQPMDKWWRRGTTTLGRPTAVLRDVALAVHHAHQHGVIHRDLKPTNILIDGENRPHVMDFGLAKHVGQNLRASYTEGGLAVGTPAYMSPEQASGARSVDRRTDVYSMGVMLYEILTGRLPFVGSSPMEVMVKTSKDPVVPPSKITTVQINPVRFKTLEAICLKALAKMPADRYSTAADFAEDLTRWLRGKNFGVSNPRLRRRLAAVALTAGVIAAVTVFLVRVRPWTSPSEVELAQADLLLSQGKAEEALGVYSRVASREKDNLRANLGRQASLQKIRETAAPLPPPDPWKEAVGLLSAVDLSRDIVSGKWSYDAGALVSLEGRPARVQIPYRPSEEYDLRMVFARHSTNFCVDLILSRGGAPFTLVMQRDGLFGLERIHGEDYHKNATLKRFDTPLHLNRPYTVEVEVRKSGIKVRCDGQPLCEHSSYDSLSMNPDWSLPDPATIGVGTWDGGAAIQRLEICEKGGKGEFVRPSAPPRKN